jgi:hypothetical protein
VTGGNVGSVSNLVAVEDSSTTAIETASRWGCAYASVAAARLGVGEGEAQLGVHEVPSSCCSGARIVVESGPARIVVAPTMIDPTGPNASGVVVGK